MAAERWQLWMPFHIDRFRGSLHVQAMPAAARAGYLYLLAAAWQSADCTLPADELDLQILSGLTHDEWVKFGPLILRRFTKREDGRHDNDVLRAEWTQAHDVYQANQQKWSELSEARSAAGKAGNAKRWGGRQNIANGSQADRKDIASPSQAHRKPIASDRFTGTGTGTVHKDKDVSAAASATPAVIGLPLVTGELHLVTAEALERLSASYPAVDVMQELRKMREWSLANKRNRKTATGIERFVVNWLGREQDRARPVHAAIRSEAKVGMVREPAVDAAFPTAELDPVLGYWRHLKANGSERYKRECPPKVRMQLEAEETAVGEVA